MQQKRRELCIVGVATMLFAAFVLICAIAWRRNDSQNALVRFWAIAPWKEIEAERLSCEDVMAEGTFISYLRVSTDRQGKSSLGLDAQRQSVTDFLNGGKWSLIKEFVEVESGSKDDRPKLSEALARCRIHNATLVIAKLGRLSRDAGFLINMQKAGVKFVAADMPQVNELTIGILACVAEAERKMISTRTKAALAAAKARGVKLGNPSNLRNANLGSAKGLATRRSKAISRRADLMPVIADLKVSGATSLRQIAAGLNERGIPTARGGKWSANQVQRVLNP